MHHVCTETMETNNSKITISSHDTDMMSKLMFVEKIEKEQQSEFLILRDSENALSFMKPDP